MNAFTKMSGKGQVVVPKATRDRLGWEPGIDLELIETRDGVTLRPRRFEKTLTPTEAVAEFQRIYRHQGPPVTLEEMDVAVAEEVARLSTRR
jgi:AbrB family looped-hinge helix DNA binding protein